MSRRAEAYLQGIPTKPYDLLKEGLIVVGFMTVFIVTMAALFGSPDYPTVNGEDVARAEPIAYVRTCAAILAGKSSTQDYGPPYTADKKEAQSLFGISPANWFGVKMPLDPESDFVLKPLARVAILNKGIAAALQVYKSAAPTAQRRWLNAYIVALDSATAVNGKVEVPAGGDYGPVPQLMDGMLALGRAGLLEGALESNARLPFTLDFTRSLLFFEQDVYHDVAKKLDMLSEQWGITHETGPYPGAWWLWPYAFLYQIPPMSTSANGDIMAGAIMGVIFILMLFLPFVPVLNSIPRWVGVHKLIWRDWYSQERRMKGDREKADRVVS